MNGRPLALAAVEGCADAIIESWHLGIQHGNAVADVLTGDYNPSGKLTATFPRVTGQIPIYYNHKNSGRPGVISEKYTSKYLDQPLTPLYPFGHGLSYTQFVYSGLTIGNPELKKADSLAVKVTLKNRGKYAGTEVVQLYVQDMIASVTRPVKELKGFRRVYLNPGEQAVVEFRIPVSSLGLYDSEMRYVVEPGDFNLMVGGSSETGLMAQFRVKD